MERLYRQLPWLDIEQALDYLKLITDPPLLLTERGLLQLGRARRVDVYVEIDPRGLVGTNLGTKEKVTLTGMQQVLNPDDAFGVSGDQTCAVLKNGDAHWVGLLPGWSQKALFRPIDIETLAANMNGAPEHPSTCELRAFRQQLDDECAKAEPAGAELEYRDRALIMSRVESVGLRAVASAVGESTPTSMVDCQRDVDRWCKILALLGLRVVREQDEYALRVSPDISSSAVLDESKASYQGLAFPYATKELQVMCEAAEKFWAGYTPDKRQPTQKEIGITIGESLKLPRQASGDPARKAIILASAIKPDSTPDA